MKSTFKNIVVSGDIGSGSTTLARELAKKLGFEFVGVGELFRKVVLEKNLSLVTELPPDWDYQMENELKERLKKEEGLVVEGHYQGWNSKNLAGVFRILVKCDPNVAHHRVVNRSYTHDETIGEVEKRRQKHRDVFKKRYGNDDYLDEKFFHLVIDTTSKPIEKCVKESLNAFYIS